MSTVRSTGRAVGKRALAAFICLTMLCGFIPAAVLSTQGADVANYVSLPITIRDYAADGMLFEWNEIGTEGDTVYTSSSTNSYGYYAVDPSSWADNGYKGIRVCTYGYTKWSAASLKWHAIICDSSGNVVKVIPSETEKRNGAYADSMQSGYYAIWVYSGDTSNYGILSAITESNKSQYKITYSTSAQQISITHSTDSGNKTFHNGDTKGFGMLATSNKDHFNDLPGTNDAIPGTVYFENGKWNDTTQPTAVSTKLNSGAPQTVYGALLRTNLVEAELDENKRPVYTKAAVTYIANLLQKTLPEVWQNSDGSYNMWYVMGHKLSDLGGTDLATKLRSQITGLGTYADAKAKYDNGSLTKYTQVTTYFDAAYFLLHNTFDDSTGYGVTVPKYTTLRLVEKQVDGRTVYVFNSGYDGTVYDYTNGVIYNTQTDTITARKQADGTTDQYVRGNILPAATFNPIAGMGYGQSGNTYKMARDGSQDNYYNDTNYNLTLEGHAQFIYYQDADLYFNFTGDDDVYLYINGIRVLDMGGAHSISKAGISLNNVAEICGLKDGEVYDFDFYYMERHGTAANFSIETNIKVVDASMLTEKIGYQNGISTDITVTSTRINPLYTNTRLPTTAKSRSSTLPLMTRSSTYPSPRTDSRSTRKQLPKT